MLRPGRVLVVLMGAPGSGKSTWAAQQGFPVASTDALRGMTDPTRDEIGRVYDAAFDLVVRALKANRRVILDTTAAHEGTRRRALRIAEAFHALPLLVVFTTPLDVCIARQEGRDRPVEPEVVTALHARIEQAMPDVEAEGWSQVSEVSG